MAPGNTSTVHSASASTRDSHSRASATSNGPTINCGRGPMRCASRPERADPINIRMVAGTSALPAAIAVQPALTCNWYTSRKNCRLIVAYRANVAMLSTVKVRDAKRAGATSGPLGVTFTA